MEFHTPTSLNNNVVGCNYTQERTQEICGGCPYREIWVGFCI